MALITTDTWQKNNVEVIIADGINWLNEWNIKEQLNHSNISPITTTNPEYLKKERQELVECTNQP